MPELDPSLFRRLAEGAPDAMIAHQDGRVVWANQAAAALAGLDRPEDLVGQSVMAFVQPVHREAIAADIARTAASSQPSTYTQTFQRPDGTRFDATLWRWLGEDGTMLVAVRNLEPERQKGVAEARARAFFDATTAALGISRLGVHVEVNEAYARLFGYAAPAELAGVPILDLIAPDEHARILDRIRRRAAGEVLPDPYLTVGRRRDGSTFTLSVAASSYVDGGDVVTIVAMSDASAEERQRHRERLEAIGRLAGGVAHDFNNLLATVIGNVELGLATLPADAPGRAPLTRIGEAAQGAADLVRQILTFGRRDTPRPAPLEPAEVVLEAVALARAALPPGLRLEVDVAPVDGAVLADRTQLQQIVLNLLMNARDAVAGDGRVEVRLDTRDGPTDDPALAGRRWARLRVRDDGVGMDPSTQAHLFEPYVTTKGGGGQGLGLAVVHGVVGHLGGVIRVDTAPGRGATFDVWLPLTAQAVPSRAAPSPAQPRTGQTVLVVDDQSLVLDTLARLVGSLGYAVRTARSGDEALGALAEATVDLMLSDVSMPGMSGVELTRRARARWPALRVVLCTGFAEAIGDAEVREAGAVALVGKPVRRATLAEVLHAALND